MLLRWITCARCRCLSFCRVKSGIACSVRLAGTGPYPATRLGGGKCETLILTTLLLFSAVLLIVLVGTLYPMIYGLMGWGRLSVGAPYFNRVTLPFGLLMLVVIVLATIRSRKVSVRCQLPALLAHTGVFIFAAGIMVSSGSRHEISLNLSPGQQVVLAGYTFRFERLDLEAKGNYTSEKARITLWRNENALAACSLKGASMPRVVNR